MWFPGADSARWAGFLGGLLLVASTEAGVFQYEDETGIVHYTNVPSDPRYRRVPGWSEPPTIHQLDSTRLPTVFAEAIRAAAERYGVNRRLVEAIVAVESSGNPGAISRKGAQGLMQLMPARAADLGVQNPFDPRQNLDGGVRHLRDLLQRFDGDLTLALAAYNAGEGAVRAYQGVPPYPETRDYVRKVRALYESSGGLERLPAVVTMPQRVYQELSDDGTVTFTNLPPNPGSRFPRRF